MIERLFGKGGMAGAESSSPPGFHLVFCCRTFGATVHPLTFQRASEQLSSDSPKVLGFRLSGKLHDEDYKKFVPLVDEAIARDGKVRMLAQFHDFHGWDLHALWDDIKFSTTHCTTIERIALVGEKKWEEWMAKVCKPFTMAKLRYFDASQVDAAWAWLKEE